MDHQVSVPVLAQADDRAVVDEALVAEARIDLRRRLLLRLRGDRAEEPDPVLLEEVDRALRERVALLDPKIPADVGMDVPGNIHSVEL